MAQNLIFFFYFLEFIMNQQSSPQKDSHETVLGWKFVIIVGILSAIFLGFFYLAMSNEPDYMPGAQRKAAQQQMHTENTEHQMDMSSEQHEMSQMQDDQNMSNMQKEQK